MDSLLYSKETDYLAVTDVKEGRENLAWPQI